MTVKNGDILKVVLDYVVPGAGTALNIFFYEYEGADWIESDMMDDFADWWASNFGSHWQANACVTANMNTLHFYRVSAVGETLKDIGTRIIDLDGSLSGENVSAAVSMWMQGNTAIPQVRGSKYVPGMAETAVSNGTLTGGALTNLLLLLGSYVEVLELQTGRFLSPGVLSKREEDFVAFAGGGQVTAIPAYQRRRKPGVGI